MDIRYDKKISFHISGTPGRHQWLQSGTDGLSLQAPTCASLRNAPIGVTCRTVTGTDIFFTAFIIMSETGLLSLPPVFVEGRRVTLQERRFRPLIQVCNCYHHSMVAFYATCIDLPSLLPSKLKTNKTKKEANRIAEGIPPMGRFKGPEEYTSFICIDGSLSPGCPCV